MLDRRWYEQEAERASRRFQKQASAPPTRRGGSGAGPSSSASINASQREGGGAVYRSRVEDKDRRLRNPNGSTAAGTSRRQVSREDLSVIVV
mmetsp:Transcript_20731/g.39416  ORF Transcript_20731/g.39416 Transcript_20731/m.39416 type:complete len:92 (-) Transcript_20731:157-432(-)